MTSQWYAIAAAMHQRGEGHSRYRAVLRFAFAGDEDEARAEFARLIRAEYGDVWQCVSATSMPCPTDIPDDEPDEGGET